MIRTKKIIIGLISIAILFVVLIFFINSRTVKIKVIDSIDKNPISNAAVSVIASDPGFSNTYSKTTNKNGMAYFSFVDIVKMDMDNPHPYGDHSDYPYYIIINKENYSVKKISNQNIEWFIKINTVELEKEKK